MVRDALIGGLEDEEIRLDILAQSKQEMTLEEVLQLAEAKESGKRSAQRLRTDNTSVSVASSYKRRTTTQQQQRSTNLTAQKPIATNSVRAAQNFLPPRYNFGCRFFSHWLIYWKNQCKNAIEAYLAQARKFQVFRSWKPTILATFIEFWLLGSQKNLVICISVRFPRWR